MINYAVNRIPNAEDIVPLMVGRARCAPGLSYGPNIRDHYIIHFCLSGGGTLIREDGEYTVSEGQIFIIRPGEEVTYTADEKNPWYYTWISFVGKRATAFDRGPSVRKSPEDIGIRLLELVEAGETSADIFTSLIYHLIYLVSAIEAAPYDRISEVRRYITYKLPAGISSSDIAKSFNYERSYLYRLFKERYGISVKQYMTDVRMRKATRMLQAGHSVAEAAYTAGYKNEFNFSAAFKKYSGVSPSSLIPRKVNKKELN